MISLNTVAISSIASMKTGTIDVTGNEVLPAASVAVAVTTSPVTNVPGLATDQVPSPSVVVVMVLPSGKVTVTVEPGSAVPVIGSTSSNSSIAITGGTVSTTSVAGVDSLPAASVAVAVTTSPLFKPGFGTVQLPSVPATTVAVVPSG
ncbi:hypothetical protein D3C78_1038420 [compost metagenome]